MKTRHLLILVLITGIHLSGYAQSGNFGTNNALHWELSDSTLTISGNGAMPSYSGSASSYLPWYTYRNAFNSVVIENGITVVGSWTFGERSRLATVRLPNSLQEIRDNAFYECSRLTTIQLPNSLQKIGYKVFARTGLREISIPSSVTGIGSSAFVDCYDLSAINVDAGNSSFCSEAGILFDKLQEKLICYPAGKQSDSYAIPETVKTIASSAFEDASALKSVSIPNSVTTIESSAFESCGLQSVVIPNSITELPYYAFRFSRLVSVVIPQSVTKIESGAFGSCYDLKYVSVSWDNPGAVIYGTSIFPEYAMYRPKIKLHVPAGTTDAYQQQYTWKYIFDIIDDGRIIDEAVLLSGLSVNTRSLSPEFNSYVFSYKVAAFPRSVETATIAGTSENAGIIVTGLGEKQLKIGENRFEINLASPDGNLHNYYELIIKRNPVDYVLELVNQQLTTSGNTKATYYDPVQKKDVTASLVDGCLLKYNLVTSNIQGNVQLRFDLNFANAGNTVFYKTLNVKPNSTYEITLNLSLQPTLPVTVVTRNDPYGQPAYTEIEYPTYNGVVSASENSDILLVSDTSIPGKLKGVSAGTGLTDKLKLSVSAYPSPATDYIIVSGLQIGETLHFYHINGNLLFSRQVSGEKENIPVGHLPSGVYFVKVNNGQVLKWVKK